MKNFPRSIVMFFVMALTIFTLSSCATHSTALNEMSNASQKKAMNAESAIEIEMSSFDLYGYKFLYKVEGKVLKFNYIDIYSDAKTNEIAEAFCNELPQVSCEKTAPGQIDFQLTEELTKDELDQFAIKANALIKTLWFNL